MVSFALLALIAMQFGLVWHAMEHLGARHFEAAGMMQAAFSEKLDAAQHDESPSSASCLKCLEDLAHTLALPSRWEVASAEMVHVMLARALPPNQIYLSPERAKQRGPPVPV